MELLGVLYLRDHVLKGLHDLGALGLLEVGEAASDDDDRRQHDTEIQLQREQKEDVDQKRTE